MSATQTRIVTEALHEAGLPRGVFNIVTGRGETVGAEISAHPDVAKISFMVGKTIVRAGAETLKRVTLELGGKSLVLILDDANLEEAVPLAIQAGFINPSSRIGPRFWARRGRRVTAIQALTPGSVAKVHLTYVRTQVLDFMVRGTGIEPVAPAV